MNTAIITLIIAILAAFGARYVPSPLSLIIMVIAGIVIIWVLLALIGVVALP
jgi:hypothetical protein